MADALRLLELIEDGIAAHGGDLGGWTRRTDDAVKLFDGRVTLRAVLHETDTGSVESAHAHVFTTLHEHEDEVLDACLFGMGNNREEALGQAALIWITGVAGPIKSFLDNKPVCMTCQAGVVDGDTSQGYSRGDYGLPGLRAYVGPSISRVFDGSQAPADLDDSKPWFRYAAESAAPRRVHLAKATILSEGKKGWRRELEIDGHDISHVDPDWPAGVRGPEFGYFIRFAVFEFPRNSVEIARRADLERTVRHFAEHYGDHASVDELMEAMAAAGFNPDLIHETESISTIAFGRVFFEQLGVEYSPTIIRARRDGRVETGVPLMSIPAYSRARALAVKLRDTMPQEAFQALCLYNAESHAIAQALDAAGDQANMTDLKMFPCVVPDRGVSNQTMEAALAALHDLVQRDRKKKPWWKFW